MLLPHAAGFMQAGHPTLDYARYLGEIAQRSAGMVVMGGSSAHEASWVHKGEVRLFEDDIVDALRPLSAAVRASGSLFFVQLSHLGREARSFRPWFPLIAPTAEPSPRTGEVPVEMSQNLIAEVRRSYVRSTKNALAAGADGVEVQVAHGFLLNEFLSPWSNRRSDDYGGPLENRMRLLREILSDIRDVCPNVVGIRVPAGEEIEGGVTWPEVLTVIRALQASELFDYVTVSVPNKPGQHVKDSSFPPGALRTFTRELRQAIDVPVIISQRIDSPELAQEILASGDADVVGIVRALIADPGWGEKALVGRPERIRPCIACLQDCRRGSSHEPIGCAVNPAFGKGEQPAKSLIRDRVRVVVVGAGPAGCEAALSAARIGARVVIFETASRAGGRARLAGLAPHRRTWVRYADYLQTAITQEERVETRFETTATVREILENEPSVIVLATGATPVKAAVDAAIPSVSPDELIAVGADPEWEHVLVVDQTGAWEAASAVETSAAKVRRVTYITPLERIGHRLPEECRPDLLARLRAAGVVCYASAVLRWEGSVPTVEVPLSNYVATLAPPDIVIWAGPASSRQELRSALSADNGPRVIAIGDALAPRGLSMATQEGWETGSRISVALLESAGASHSYSC